MPGENRPRTWEVPWVPRKTEVGITERKTGMPMTPGKSDRSIVLGGRESRPQEGEERKCNGEGTDDKPNPSQETCPALEADKACQPH